MFPGSCRKYVLPVQYAGLNGEALGTRINLVFAPSFEARKAKQRCMRLYDNSRSLRKLCIPNFVYDVSVFPFRTINTTDLSALWRKFLKASPF